jgi:hypothetical protein
MSWSSSTAQLSPVASNPSSVHEARSRFEAGRMTIAVVSDACAYRRIMSIGSAKAAIARAEQLAGRSIDRRVVAQGVHSHDDGRTWHDKD